MTEFPAQIQQIASENRDGSGLPTITPTPFIGSGWSGSANGIFSFGIRFTTPVNLVSGTPYRFKIKINQGANSGPLDNNDLIYTFGLESAQLSLPAPLDAARLDSRQLDASAPILLEVVGNGQDLDLEIPNILPQFIDTVAGMIPAGTDLNLIAIANPSITRPPNHFFNTNSIELVIDDAEAPPNTAPQIGAVGSLSGQVGSSVSIAAAFTDPDPGDSHTATIDWGDGPEPAVVSGSQISGSHVYDDPYSGPVIVAVTDSAGEGDSISVNAEISEAPGNGGGGNPPPVPASVWPTRLDLAIGETQQVQFGSEIVEIRLNSRTVFDRLSSVWANITVTHNGISKSKDLIVGGNTVPVVVNGARIFAYVWKEADDGGFENVGLSGGSIPLDGGKDIGFLVSDPAAPMYPLQGSSPMATNEPFTSGMYQNFLEENNPGQAHAGYDHAMVPGDQIRLPVECEIHQINVNFNNNQGEPDGQIQVRPTWSQQSVFETGWIYTHINIATVPANVVEGAVLPAGTLIGTVARSGGIPSHVHIGSARSFDGGSWRFFCELYDHHLGKPSNTPKSWLMLPPGQNWNGGDPLAGVDGWFLQDNGYHGIANVKEMYAPNPLTGTAPNRSNTFGHQATYVWSNADVSGTIEVGVSQSGELFVNKQSVWANDSGRYSSYNPSLDPMILKDQFSVAVTLRRGWNEIVLRSTNGGDGNKDWLTSLRFNVPGITWRSFSTRSLAAQGSVSQGTVNLSWASPVDPWTHFDGFRVEIDGIPAGQTAGNTLAVNGVTNGEHLVKIIPTNAGGDVSARADGMLVTVTDGGELEIPFSQSPPGGLQPSEIPQFVLLGFDDNGGVSGGPNQPYDILSALLAEKSDAFGRFIPATFYSMGMNMMEGDSPQTGPKGNQFSQNMSANGSREHNAGLKRAFDAGHEIGNHGTLGLAFGQSFDQWYDNLEVTQRMLVEKVGIPVHALRGVRAAQDVFNQSMYDAMEALNDDLGYTFEYGCSERTWHQSNLPGWFPGTYEAGYNGQESWDSRGRNIVKPGFFGVPQAWGTGPGGNGNGNDHCDTNYQPGDGLNGFPGWLLRTLDLALSSNRAPVSLCMHGQYYPAGGGRYNDLALFIDTIIANPSQYGDVRFVTHQQLISWMKNPVDLATFDAGTGGGGGNPPANTAPTIPAQTPKQVPWSVDLEVPFNDPDIGDSHTATVDWGDGGPVSDATVNAPVNGVGSITASHEYQAANTYQARVTIQDSVGATATVTVDIEVTGVQPVGDVNVNVEAAAAVRIVPANFASAGITIWNFASDPTKPNMQSFPHVSEFARMTRNRVSRWGGGNWANAQGFSRRTDRLMERYGGSPWATTVDSDPASITFGQVYGYRHVYTPQMIESVAEWSRETGTDLMVQCNLLDSNPETITHDDGQVETFAGGMWADMVRFCRIENNFGFRYWELGNEYDFVKPWGHSGSQHAEAAVEMARRFVRQYNAMKAVDSTIRIGFPAIAGATENHQGQYTWMKTVAAEMARLGVRPDFISWHYYGNANATGPTGPDPDFGWRPSSVMEYDEYAEGSTFGTPGAKVPLTGGGSWIVRGKRIYAELQVREISRIWNQAIGEVPEMWITEWNWHAGVGDEPPHRHLITVPWLVDVGMRLRDEGVSGLMYYNLFEGGNDNGMLSADGYRMSIYGLIMLNQLVGDNVLAVTSDREGFGAHGSRDQAGNVWVHLINDSDEVIDVQVNVNGLGGTQIDRATEWRFNNRVDWIADATGQDADINGWQPSIHETAEENLDRLYSAGEVTQIPGTTHTVRLMPWQPAVVAFSNAPVLPPPPIKPIADATLLPLSGPAPHTAVLKDQSRGAIDSFAFDPGDGSAPQTFAQIPSGGLPYTYAQPSGDQPYKARLTVRGPGGSHFTEWDVEVAGQPTEPINADFDFTMPHSGTGDTFTHRFRFTGSGSPSSYQWTVFDGPIQIAQGVGVEFEYRFPAIGTYRVVLEAFGNGVSDSQAYDVTVFAPSQPVADFEVTVDPNNPLRVSVTNKSHNLSQSRLEWGDGSQVENPRPTEIHTYNAPGEYEIKLSGTDEFGQPDEAAATVLLIQPAGQAGLGNTALVVGIVGTGIAISIAASRRT